MEARGFGGGIDSDSMPRKYTAREIGLERYYTPSGIAEKCMAIALDAIGDIPSEILEPSAGPGAFLGAVPSGIRAWGMDMDPSVCGGAIAEGDFLASDIECDAHRLTIGNPPFGRALSTAMSFYRKSCLISGWVAFILPISQLGGGRSMYQFDLIASEDLGEVSFSGPDSPGRPLRCCFNVWKRPESGVVNPRPKSGMDGITIARDGSKGYSRMDDFDMRMWYWGRYAGKELESDDGRTGQYKIRIDRDDWKEPLLEAFRSCDWKSRIASVLDSEGDEVNSNRRIQKYHIIELAKEVVSKIEGR